MNKKLLFLLLYLFACLPIVAQDISLQSKRLSVTDGLPCNTINDIIQDRDGYIWLATLTGMSRFDGYSFVNYNHLDVNGKRQNATAVTLLMSDENDGVVWGYTQQRELYCYDLEKAQFVDYTGIGENDRRYNNRLLTPYGLYIYDAQYGIRYITRKAGKYQVQDFLEEKHQLLSKRQMNLAEDKNHMVWVSSNKGLERLSPQGKREVLLKDKNIIVKTINDTYCAVLTDKGEAYLYSLNGKLAYKAQLPSMMGFVGKSRASMFWKGAWYIFTEGDTFAFDLKSRQFFKPALQIPNANNKNPMQNYTCLYDKKGNLWFFGKNGWMKKLHLMDDNTLINMRDKNFSAQEDMQGKIYISSYGNGLYLYHPKTDHLQHFSCKDENPIIGSDFLLDLYIDKSNCVWLATGSGMYCVKELGGFDAHYVKVAEEVNQGWSNSIRHIHIKDGNKVIASTKANKTYLYDVQTRKSSCILETKSCVYSYKTDVQGNIWIGTKGDGLFVNGLRYSKRDAARYMPSNNIYDVVVDKLGRAWIATWGDGLLLTKKQGDAPLKFQQFLTESKGQIHDLMRDAAGRVWVANNEGLVMVDATQEKITPQSFLTFNTANHTLPVDQILSLIQAKNGDIWLGTIDGVLKCQYDAKTKHLAYQQFTTDDGLINNSVRSLVEDSNGDIWVATEEGISRIDGKNLNMTSFTLSKVLEENVYTENCMGRLADGTIVFGSSKGLLFIKPRAEKPTTMPKLTVSVTDIIINGQSIYSDEMKKYIDKSITYAKEIRLPHDKNSLSVHFSNFFYPEIGTTKYQFYLAGLDKTWRPRTSRNHVDFSELNPGHYTLHLRTLNGDNQWSEETTMRITIQEPWYNTWWAWLIYLIVFGTIAYYMYSFWRRSFDLHQEVKMEKQISAFRIEFFTHISHEFRTPLAIIQSAVENIEESDGKGISKRTMLTLHRGTKRMQRLINQLMEFRKVNTGNSKLAVERGDIVEFVRNIYNDIWTIASQKEINITFMPWTHRHEMFFDMQKIEAITYNLLSNAVKYTPDKGRVVVKLKLADAAVVMTVEDSGKGISPEREHVLFKPFMHGYVSKGGMGIGLYTAHEMALIHKGSLTYQKSADLGGSLFTLSIPADDAVYAESERRPKLAIDRSSIEKEEIDQVFQELKPQAINNITVAVIEDDPDMMEQIKSELSVYFHVEAYMSGKVGYEKVRETKPALLVCDIMLPDMSGYEIVSNLKADVSTQNIPVIMLTSLDDAAHMMKAYKAFADDYMVKPCNFKLLIARALQFVTAKQRTQTAPAEKSAAQTAPQEHETILVSPQDKRFKNKVEAIVAQHLGEQDFNVDRLAELLNIGRTTVYNRTKAILGVPPNMYIQNERLRIAADLLLQDEYTIAEISDKVGFSDPTYFYKCFKNKYGVAPSKYGKS